MKRRTKQALGLLTAVLLIPLGVKALDSRLAVQHYSLTSPKLTGNHRLLVLTDLHSSKYGQEQRELLETAAAQRPDALLLVGDMVDDKLPENNAWDVIAPLAAKYPTFYVTGNHEWRSGRLGDTLQRMKELGVTVLRGTSATLPLGEDTITLWGVDDPDGGLFAQQWAALTGEVREEDFNILLAHRPELIDTYLQLPFQLVVSGHAHGGQWRIPRLINGLLAPNQGLFPPYAGGRYNFNTTTFLVSRGLSRDYPSIPRLFNPPELLVVELTGNS